MFESLKGMFGGKSKKQIIIGAPVEGKAVSIKEVNDPTFADEILGKGMAIIPSKGRIVAPVDGTIGIMFDTKHAVSITSKEGTEILVHVGLDTVNLKGEFYTGYVQAEQEVKKGDLLIEFDIEKVKAAGYDVITPVIICNSPDYAEFEAIVGKDVAETEDVIKLS